MEYEYEALEDPDTEIRLVAVQPGGYADPLIIEFHTRSLKVSNRSPFCLAGAKN